MVELKGKSGKANVDLSKFDPSIPSGRIRVDISVNPDGIIEHSTPIIIGK